MRSGATEVNETQKWATSKKALRATDLYNNNNTINAVTPTIMVWPPDFTLVSISAYFFDPEDKGDMFLRNVG
jgi:hypothetical protein